jgi:hypothetical protein
MTVPYTFGTATTSIPLSNLDSNFNTPITLGNTSIYLGNTTTTIGNLTLTNATISSGNVTISNISVTTANVTTANVATLSVTGTATIATANITTGNITTLTSTSITDSGLTSGRVTYAGASGLLSDSANLTFNGSALGVNGTTTIGNQLSSGTSGSFSITGVGGAVYLQTGQNTSSASAAPLVFTNSGAANEWMRITSAGNVGIGTSSPSYVLDVAGSTARLKNTSGSADFILSRASSSAGASISLNTGDTNKYFFGLRGLGDDNFYFYNNIAGNTALVIDTSSNLGLGVTPSAWGTSGAVFKAIEYGTVGNAVVGIANNSSMDVMSNAYYNAGWKYANSSRPALRASLNGDVSGAFTWNQAPSGTAGNAITFTQAMTLDASGNLGVGTSSPTSFGGFKTLELANSSGNAISLVTGTAVIAQTIASNTNGLVYTGTRSNHSLVFTTNDTERMRIDSSGNLLVGTTTVAIPNPGISIAPGNGSQIGVGHGSGSTDGTYYHYFGYNGSIIGSITQSGTTAVLYNLTSDQRLKENIVDALSGNIDDIKVRSFDWIADGSHQEYGMVAQELIEVAPYAVNKPENPDEMMGVDYSKLVPMMIKEIQDLKQRIATLENK